MKLISMTEFVLQNAAKCSYKEYSETVIRYARFLRQPLTLGMFVPVDEKGNVFKNPHARDEDAGTEKEELQIEFNNALEKVLFEGCEVIEIKKDINYFVVYHKSRQIWISWTDRIIEDMILSRTYLDGLELTPSALKQVGL